MKIAVNLVYSQKPYVCFKQQQFLTTIKRENDFVIEHFLPSDIGTLFLLLLCETDAVGSLKIFS